MLGWGRPFRTLDTSVWIDPPCVFTWSTVVSGLSVEVRSFTAVILSLGVDYSVITINPDKSVKQCGRHIDRLSNLALVFSGGLTKHKHYATQVLKRILVFLYQLACLIQVVTVKIATMMTLRTFLPPRTRKSYFKSDGIFAFRSRHVRFPPTCGFHLYWKWIKFIWNIVVYF